MSVKPEKQAHHIPRVVPGLMLPELPWVLPRSCATPPPALPQAQVKYPMSQQPNRCPQREGSRTDGQDRSTIGHSRHRTEALCGENALSIIVPNRGEKKQVQTERWINRR